MGRSFPGLAHLDPGERIGHRAERRLRPPYDAMRGAPRPDAGSDHRQAPRHVRGARRQQLGRFLEELFHQVDELTREVWREGWRRPDGVGKVWGRRQLRHHPEDASPGISTCGKRSRMHAGQIPWLKAASERSVM